MKTTEKNHAERNAINWFGVISKLILQRRTAQTDREREQIEDEIRESVLFVGVRDGFHPVGEVGELDEFEILLTTGGPALRILGDLDGYLQPKTAVLQYQDWGTPWTNYVPSTDNDALLEFCSVFYFGE